MREVVIVVSCDVCSTATTEEGAITATIAGVLYEADLCPAHMNDWTTPLRPVPKTKEQCADCTKTFTTQSGLARHREKAH